MITPRSFCVTVDVEDFFPVRPPGYDTLFAAMPEGEYGIGRMMELLERHSARGTFFVDVYNRTTVDEDTVRRACRAVAERDHEVGLHTHPAFPTGRRGYGMKQVLLNHDLAWQTEFIRQGAQWMREWTGRHVAAHRAGGYGANADTLSALEANGIAIDSSLLHGYAGCGLNAVTPLRNRPHALRGVVETPISVTRNRFLLRTAGVDLELFAMVQKIDLDWLDLPELKTQISSLVDAGVDPVVIFLHSYSFLRLDRGYRPHHANVAKFDALLGWLNGIPGARIESLSAAAGRIGALGAGDDPLPGCTFYLNADWQRWVRWAAGTVRPAHARLVARHLMAKVLR